MIHTVVQIVRVVGFTDGPGFSIWGDGGFFVAKMLDRSV